MNYKKYEKFISGKKILVTGGTGSFGNFMVNSLIDICPEKIIIFSRDEDKQYTMKKKFNGCSNLQFEIGDVRDYNRLVEVTKNVDIIYHAAALKHVPSGEDFPMELIKTNVLGTENVANAAIHNDVEVVVEIGTDKAVEPINVYGMTKALQEKIMLAKNSPDHITKFIGVRYGNVIGSRGSVIPFFKELICKGEPLPITDERMTRFLLPLEKAIDLVFKATQVETPGVVYVKKMPAAKVVDLAKVMIKEISGKEDYPIQIVGIRAGEKIHETLVSKDEMRRVIETDNEFIIYPYGKLKAPELKSNYSEYTSQNTEQYNNKQIKEILIQTGWL